MVTLVHLLNGVDLAFGTSFLQLVFFLVFLTRLLLLVFSLLFQLSHLILELVNLVSLPLVEHPPNHHLLLLS